MDIKKEVQLGNRKFINSVNTDYFQNFELTSSKKEIIEYDIKNILSVTEVFNTERQETDIYRVYGRIEYLSLLNNIKTNYTQLADFFTPIPITGNSRTILNSFDFYLVKPSTGYTSLGNDKYVKLYEVMSKISDFDIYRSGYFVNIYNEQQYLFNFKKDFNVSNYLDGLHFPVGELALYVAYKTSNNETMERRNYDSSSDENNFTKISYTYVPLNIGDKVYGNLLSYDMDEYSKELINDQTYYISCPYTDGTLKNLVFKYNPIIDIPIKYLDDTLNIVNPTGTSYQNIQSIPYYAIQLANGNYVWREVLEKGFFDPITGIGVNYPFINQRQYVFKNYFLSVIPDLTDPNTASVFNELKYKDNTELSKSPTDLNNMGNIC